MKKQSGFLLVAAVGVLMIAAASMLLLQVAAVLKERQQELARLQQQLHEARIQLFWQALTIEEDESWIGWQTSPARTNWLNSLAQQGVPARIEIQPLRLVVNLHSELRAQELSQRLVESEAIGSELHLTVPEKKPYDNNPIHVKRSAETPQTMATHLIGGANDILNGKKVAGTKLDVESLNAFEANAQQSEIDTVNARSISGVQLDASSGLASFSIKGEEVIGENAILADTSSSHIMVAQASLEALQADTFESGESHLLSAVSHEVIVDGSVEITGQQLPSLMTFQVTLDGLENAIYHCLNESEWCLAAVKPTLLDADCYQCQSEQFGTSFLAVLRYYVADCRHGCGIRLQVPENISVDCPIATIPPQQSGWLRCELSGVLDTVEEVNFVAKAQLYSGKNTSVYTEHQVPIRWQLASKACAAMAITVTIQERWPPATYTLIFPSTAGGKEYTWNSNIEYPCNNTTSNQLMFCDMAGECSRYGDWLITKARCICRDW